jgi:Biopolymer transport protein
MAIKRQHNMVATFSMASMTDVIFLLLIFFMVTSTFVFPSALEVNLPQSSEQTAIKPFTRVFIDKDMNVSASQDNNEVTPLPADQLFSFLKAVKASQSADPTASEQFVALYADEAVPYGKIVEVLDMGSKCGLKIVLATKPASSTYSSQKEDAVAQQPAQQPVATQN